MSAMRRLFVLFMLCLLPLQISWAAVSDYGGHEPGQTAHHFDHHDDERTASSGLPDNGPHPHTDDLGHDHCHMSGFLSLMSETVFFAAIPSALLPSSRHNEATYASLVLDRPERPKWHVLA